MQPLNILIIGAGAIGTLVGGKLAQAGLCVTLVGRERFVIEVEEHGLQIVDEQGVRHVSDLIAVASINAAYQASIDDFDVAIVTVKSYDTAAAIAELADALDRNGAQTPLVLSLQNGVGNEEQIAESLGDEHVAAGVIMTPVTVLGPAHVRVDRPGYAVGLSCWQPNTESEPFLSLPQAFVTAGFDVAEYPEARGLKWTKLLMNMIGNATSAILDEPPEEVFQDPGIVDLEIGAWREALAVMEALDIEPVNLGSYPFAKLAPWIRHAPKPIIRPVLRRQVGSARGGKMPSLHIDLYGEKGKSEIGWLNGAVVKHGRAVHVSTPVNQTLVQALTCVIHDSNKRDLWRRNGLRLIVSAEDVKARQQ